MALYVKKFGGSSVATTERMKNIASRILREKHDNDKIVIVVSAMGDSTDDLLALAGQVPSLRHGREMDMLLSTGEQVSISLLAMTFKSLGAPAISLTGMQAGVFCSGTHGKALIDDVKPEREYCHCCRFPGGVAEWRCCHFGARWERCNSSCPSRCNACGCV